MFLKTLSRNTSRDHTPLVIQRLGPSTLKGDLVNLAPLRTEHAMALLEAAGKLDWGWFLNPLHTKEEIDARISWGLRAEKRNEAYAFAVRQNDTGHIVGSTSYLDISPKDKKVEIGSTWYVSGAQGTKVNPESKYLLLGRAFDDWGANRVQFTTDANNLHSQRAILKLGAKLEGKLRSDRVRKDGTLRDSMVYSILASEWPEIKRNLHRRVYG